MRAVKKPLLSATPPMRGTRSRRLAPGLSIAAVLFLLLFRLPTFATDWPQFRGPTTDGATPDPIATTWATGSPGFIIWTNLSLTNGFSSFAISQGRAFTQISKGTTRLEYCVAVNTTTGTNLWATPIDTAPWDPNSASTSTGGDGNAPCNTGDGPRTTPSVKNGRVFALSGKNLHLLGLNATNGAVIWSNNLATMYGATTVTWENGASPRLDDDLIFVNLNTATAGFTLLAFNTTNGAMVWQSQADGATQATPVIATIVGIRQVIFATVDRLASLDRSTGNLLWSYPYSNGPVGTAMGASPVVYSNIVFASQGYGAGSAAVRVTLAGSIWTVTQLWANSATLYNSTWMTPVCYQGYIYGQFSNKGFTNTPLNCIELATGTLKWTTNRFGMGGIMLVNTNLLVVTEDGQLVLVRPNPTAYTELARYRAFQFTASAPGKCWNCAAYSDGRIYLRSTRGGVSLNVAPPASLPSPVTVGVSNITSSAATLCGTVNPNGAATIAWFQWGLTSSYGSNTLTVTNLTGSLPLTVSNTLTGLAPATTYHFRLAATNSAGTTNGADFAFATLPLPPRLQLFAPQFLSTTQLQLFIRTTNGTPIASNRLANIEVRATNILTASPLTWPRLTNSLALTTNGLLVLTNVITGSQTQLFYITIEHP